MRKKNLGDNKSGRVGLFMGKFGRYSIGQWGGLLWVFSLFYSYVFLFDVPFFSNEGKWDVFDRCGHPGTPSPGIRLRCAGPPDKNIILCILNSMSLWYDWLWVTLSCFFSDFCLHSRQSLFKMTVVFEDGSARIPGPGFGLGCVGWLVEKILSFLNSMCLSCFVPGASHFYAWPQVEYWKAGVHPPAKQAAMRL